MVTFHRELNRATAENWATFTAHRERVTALISEVAPPDAAGTLAILGAGNCNDLALDCLAPKFTKVHLFDIDRDAVTRARARQTPEIADRLALHAPLDLGGALGEVSKLRRRQATPAELGGMLGAGIRTLLPNVSERFDVVASTCLISQLVHSCQRLLGEDHPQIQEIACAVVVAHLRIVAALIKPGGSGLIVTDTVSSDTYPLEELFATRPPWALIDELEATGNHLSGTTPKFLRRILNTDPFIAPTVAGSSLVEPWLWALSADETYLVYALQFTRRT
jgi:hypothetical protein